jgi:hypothetical protein
MLLVHVNQVLLQIFGMVAAKDAFGDGNGVATIVPLIRIDFLNFHVVVTVYDLELGVGGLGRLAVHAVAFDGFLNVNAFR